MLFFHHYPMLEIELVLRIMVLLGVLVTHGGSFPAFSMMHLHLLDEG
jgi:hypothetical protein